MMENWLKILTLQFVNHRSLVVEEFVLRLEFLFGVLGDERGVEVVVE